MALIDLTTYKNLMGVQSGNTRDDAQITALLEPASQAIQTYTGRNFALATTSSSRSYLYDGSGFMDIDDCTAVTTVQVTYPNTTPYTLTSDEYQAMPDGNPVYYYLILYGGIAAYGISPEMGFTYNLDQYPFTQYKPPTVSVTATWGWSAVPYDVQLATALTIQNFVATKNAAEGLSAEAIEGYSRSWGSRQGLMTAMAVPNKARDLLAAYQRIFT